MTLDVQQNHGLEKKDRIGVLNVQNLLHPNTSIFSRTKVFYKTIVFLQNLNMQIGLLSYVEVFSIGKISCMPLT